MQGKMTREELKKDFLERIIQVREGTKQFEIKGITYPSSRETIKHLLPSLFILTKKALK
ncbi:hypothetical protein SFC23_00525 [Shouchella clausii]|uniref:hypothetical protein n=1 Tax=Shouchella clausii TaxID=79880 RepID=UPI0015CA17F2|nr:hypothetical protein [Shouchella clausii]